MGTVLDIQGFSFEDRQELLPALSAALASCGGWVLDRRVLSAVSVEMQVEVGVRSVLEMYSNMMQSGLELTRTGHSALTELCLCLQHVGFKAAEGKTVTMRLEVSFLNELENSALVYAAMA